MKFGTRRRPRVTVLGPSERDPRESVRMGKGVSAVDGEIPGETTDEMAATASVLVLVWRGLR